MISNDLNGLQNPCKKAVSLLPVQLLSKYVNFVVYSGCCTENQSLLYIDANALCLHGDRFHSSHVLLMKKAFYSIAMNITSLHVLFCTMANSFVNAGKDFSDSFVYGISISNSPYVSMDILTDGGFFMILLICLQT